MILGVGGVGRGGCILAVLHFAALVLFPQSRASSGAATPQRLQRPAGATAAEPRRQWTPFFSPPAPERFPKVA